MNPLFYSQAPAREVAEAMHHAGDIGHQEIISALINALRRIDVLERTSERRRQALSDLLDIYHQGQITVREEASGHLQSLLEAGEAAIASGVGGFHDHT